MKFVERIALQILALGSHRHKEYEWARVFLKNHRKVLDVACGTGTFLEFPDFDSVGIDINPQNVKFCRERNLNAILANALEIPFPDGEFDSVHCSHLMQVLTPQDAVHLIQEMARVTRPGGRIVVTTLNDFRSFYRHPENSRPYPPDALRRLFGLQKNSQSPMFPNLPHLQEIDIKLRHPAMIEFRFSSSKSLGRFASVLSASQIIVGLLKFWRFDAYTICFEKRKA